MHQRERNGRSLLGFLMSEPTKINRTADGHILKQGDPMLNVQYCVIMAFLYQICECFHKR